MATFTERIQFVVEAVTGTAEKNLKGLRGEMAKAEGVTGKAKAAFGGLGDALKANLLPGIAGAGAAIAAFALNGAKQFADMAREAGRLADTVGLTTEQSSRWLSVLRPLNVEGADLADILGNINSKAAEGRLAELGIDAADSHERLKQTIELLGSITDETKRAALMNELLGEEGTRQLAPLIADFENLRKKIAEVSDTEVITAEERADAAEYDEAIRNLNAAFRDLSTELGQDVIPLLTVTVGLLSDVLDLGRQLEAGGGLANMLGFDVPDWVRPLIPFTDPARREVVNEPGVVSNATYAPRGTPGVWGPSNVTVTVNNPPGTDGRQVASDIQNYYRANGQANTSGLP